MDFSPTLQYSNTPTLRFVFTYATIFCNVRPSAIRLLTL